MPFLSVLIPTYNRPKQLFDALDSLKNLGEDIEVVIGNNGQVENVTKALHHMQSIPNLRVIHNKSGSTYPENLSVLVGSACGEWLTILHDDDFFTCEASVVMPLLNASKNLDFIFSDHYIVDSHGDILSERSDHYLRHYGRFDQVTGPVPNLQLLLARNSIAMDCFFVRTSLAKSCKVDTSLKCFADLDLLAQIVFRAGSRSFYLSNRLFAYRINEGLTTSGLLQDELLLVLQRIRALFDDPQASDVLNSRVRMQAMYSLKFSLKRCKPRSVCAAIMALVFGGNH